MRAAADVDSIVIRAGDFFGGTGSGTWFDMALASRLAAGRYVYPGNPTLAHAWAYLPDLAQVFRPDGAAPRRTARAPSVPLRRAHADRRADPGGDRGSRRQPAAGRQPALGTDRLLAPFKPMWAELVTMRYLWERAHRLEDPTLTQWIGTVPCTPLPQAIRVTLPQWAGSPVPTGPIQV